jgi:hypothetical protein
VVTRFARFATTFLLSETLGFLFFAAFLSFYLPRSIRLFSLQRHAH